MSLWIALCSTVDNASIECVGRAVAERLVRALEIVEIEVSSDAGSSFVQVIVGMKEHLLLLE